MYGVLIYPQQNFRSRKKRASLVWIGPNVVHTSPANSPSSKRCSDPRAFVKPLWKWNCCNMYVSPRPPSEISGWFAITLVLTEHRKSHASIRVINVHHFNPNPNLISAVARYCFHPVCLCICVSVCPANILVFYFSAIRRDTDLKFIQDTYRFVLNSLKHIDLHRSNVKVTWTVHCFLKVVISQKLSHRKYIRKYIHRHLLGYSIRWNNKILSEQRNNVTINTSIFDFNM